MRRLRTRPWKARLAILLLALLFLISSALVTANATYELSWWTVDGGGGSSTGSGYKLSGTIGQFDAGFLSGQPYELEGGYWTGPVSVYLPVVLNSF